MVASFFDRASSYRASARSYSPAPCARAVPPGYSATRRCGHGRAAAPLAHRQGFLIHRPCLVVIARALIAVGHIVGGAGDVQVLGTGRQHRFADGQGLLLHRLSLIVLPRPHIQVGRLLSDCARSGCCAFLRTTDAFQIGEPVTFDTRGALVSWRSTVTTGFRSSLCGPCSASLLRWLQWSVAIIETAY